MLELYKDLIVDHGNNPRNKYIMHNYTHFSRGYNYLCGDKCEIYLVVKNNLIDDISFSGTGCVISIASSSLMTVNFKKKKLDEALYLFNYFLNIVTGKANFDNKFEDLNILANVKRFPNRVKCATLIWHTFKSSVSLKKDTFNF